MFRRVECRKVQQVKPKRMNTHPKSCSTYKFGPYYVDVPAGQVRKHGKKLRLAGQPFDILIMLLEHAGQVVTREEIQQRLWSGETFVDFENSLNKAINKLRQAFADSAEEPVYVETLPRRGYRFIGSLDADGSAKVGAGVVPANIHEAGRSVESEKIDASRQWPIPRRVAAFLSSGLLIALGTWFAARPRPNARVVGTERLTTSSRIDAFGGIQTDGVRLFFLQRRGHRWELSQMPVSGGEIQPFSTPFQNATILAVSPDASELIVAPFESRTDALPLWIMPSVGGAPRRLANIVASDAVFTPDARRVTYCDDRGIFEIGRDGISVRKILDIGGAKAGLSWSPDGKELRFQWTDTKRGGSDIWSVDANGANLREVTRGWKGARYECCGKWTRDGRYYMFLGFQEDGTKDLWALREKSGFFQRNDAPVRLNAGPLMMHTPLPSRDGRHLYVLGSNLRTEFVHYDEKTREFRSLLGGADGAWPNFSPDGSLIVFVDSGGALCRSKLDGSERRELVGRALSPAMPMVHPDGKVIAFRGIPAGATNSRIYEIPIDGGQPTEIVSENFSLDTPAWSHDGSKLVYAIDSAAGPAAGLYVLDRKTGQKRKLPESQPFWKSRWSPDGKQLASVTANNKLIGIFNWSTQQWKEAVHGKLLGPVGWSKNGQYLYFQDILEEDEPLRRLRIKDGRVERMVECRPLLEGGVQRCGFEEVMPDGSIVLHLTRGDHDVYTLDLELP
jgi:Tol biopolymer transport system component/DNA-binding winged helix-turn-helix (wHTH) protein